jgi:hypothetical protein
MYLNIRKNAIQFVFNLFGINFFWERGMLFETYLSNVAASIYLPFGENLTNETGGLSSSIRVFRHCPDAVSHIRLEFDKIKVKRKISEFHSATKAVVLSSRLGSSNIWNRSED